MGQEGDRDIPRLQLPADLCYGNEHISLSVMIDSGCEQTLIDSELVNQLGVETIPLPSPIHVSALNGKSLPQISQDQPFTFNYFWQPQ